MEPTHTPLPLKGAHNHSSAPTIMRPLQGRFLFLIVFIVGASPYARLYSPFGAYKVGAEMRWPFCVFIGPFRDFFCPHRIPDIGRTGRGTTHCRVGKKQYFCNWI